MLHVGRYGRLFINMSIHAARRLWHFGLTDLVTRDAARGSLDVWRRLDDHIADGGFVALWQCALSGSLLCQT